MKPPAHGFVDRAQAGFVIASNNQFELRYVLKKILPHESGAYLVTASQVFDLGFCPAPAMLDLHCSDKARPQKPGAVRGMLVVVRRSERLDGRAPRIFARYAADGGDENRLAVLAGTVQKEQSVFGCDARKGVAEHAAQERLQLGIAIGDAIEEAKPQSRRLVCNSCTGDLRAEVFTAMFTDFTSLQINNPRWSVQFPWIGIPLFDSHRVTAVRTGQTFDRSNGARLGGLAAEAGVLDALGGGVSRYDSCQIEHHKRLISEPSLSGPAMPLAQAVRVTQVIGVVIREAECECIIRELWWKPRPF